MHTIGRLILSLLLLLLFILSIAFSLGNTTEVGLSFGIYSFAPQPVAVWVIGAFCCGGLIGLILGHLRPLRKDSNSGKHEVNRGKI